MAAATVRKTKNADLAELLSEILHDFEVGHEIVKVASTMSKIEIQSEIDERLKQLDNENLIDAEREQLEREAQVYAIMSLRRYHR